MDGRTHGSKKRKRAQDDSATVSPSQPLSKKGQSSNTSTTTRVIVSEPSSSSLGPILVSYPSIKPPKSTAFTQWVKAKPGESVDLDEQPNFVIGESDKAQFSSVNHDGPHMDYASHYMIGVYDKTTNIVTLRAADMHIITAEVTALQSIDSIKSKSTQGTEARHALGEAFGTKKAKSAIRAAERGKVDISTMQDVASHLQESITVATTTLPTQEEATATTDLNRPIPPVDMEAKTAADAYPLYSTVSQNELNAVDLSPILGSKSEQERRSLLPSHRSTWINGHLANMFSAAKPSKTNLRVLYYISCLVAFRNMSDRLKDKATLQEKLSTVPSVIVDGLVTRFTETARQSSQLRVTPHTQLKLLNYILVLCLRLDDYSSNIAVLAADLQMPMAKVESHFKSLGCKIDSPTATQRAALELSKTDINASKCATLKVPLTFPKARTGAKKSR